MDTIKTMKVADLRKALSDRGLPSSGGKEDLKKRLRTAVAEAEKEEDSSGSENEEEEQGLRVIRPEKGIDKS